MRPFLAAERPILFAHRGGAASWPENTLTAFQGAIDLGYQYIETDVWLTRDDVLVVFHDEHLDRTTNGSGRVGDHTLAELKQLDAGYRFERGGQFPFRGHGLTIPTFEEALALQPKSSGRLRWNVELKPQRDAVVDVMWRLIEKHQLHEDILIAASHDPLVRAFRATSHGTVATGAGTREALAFWAGARAGRRLQASPPFDALQVPESQKVAGPFSLMVLSDDLIQAAHAADVHVHAWVIDRPEDMRRLISMGVDGIMTDEPAYLMQVAGTCAATT